MHSPATQRFELERLDFETVRLELTRPLVTAVKTITEREIIVLRATIRVDGHRAIGFGEVAPLPGWSTETLAECLALLDTMTIPASFTTLEHLDEALPLFSKLPSLRFGVELALLDALARQQNISITEALAPYAGAGESADLPTSIALQSTVGALPLDALLAHAEQAQRDGFGHLKIKVGVDPLHEDIAKIAALCAHHPALKIRLDANGAWSIAEALGITHAIARDFPGDAVELIEQPVAPEDFDEFLAQFSAQFGQRGASFDLIIAADESAESFERCTHLIEGGVMRAIVLKPATLGGLIPCAKLMAQAKANDVAVILSNLITSAIGRRAVAQLAAAFPAMTGPHGLATGGWFRQDTAPEADPIEGAKLLQNTAPGLGFEPTVAFPSTEATP